MNRQGEVSYDWISVFIMPSRGSNIVETIEARHGRKNARLEEIADFNGCFSRWSLVKAGRILGKSECGKYLPASVRDEVEKERCV